MASATTDRRMGLTGDKGMKAPVRAATTGAITLSGEQSIDSVACVTGDRVLVKNQVDTTTNGIYDVSTAAWTRSIDSNGNQDLVKGTTWLVTDGGQAGQYWQVASSNPIQPGTTALTFSLSLTASSSLLSFTQAGSGAAVRSALAKMREIISVVDFGAVGDGVTDDTASINAAVTAAAGRTLFFPKPSASYLISSTITISTRMRLLFEGANGNAVGTNPSTFLTKKSTMTTDAFTITASGTVIEGGGIVGQGGNTGNGVTILANGVSISDFTVFSAGTDGIRIGKDAAGGNSNSTTLINVIMSGNGRYGLNLHDNAGGAPNCNAGTFTRCFTLGNTSHGVYVQNACFNTFIGHLSESNTGSGLRVATDAVSNTFIGGDLEANTATDLVLDASTVHGYGTGGNQFIGTAVGTVPVDNATQTSRGWKIGNGFGATGGSGTINGEGSWTPVVAGTSTPGTNIYATQTGRWFKNGRLVTAPFDIQTSGSSSAMAGNLTIGGLPFSSLTGSLGAFAPSLVSLVTLPSSNYSQITGAMNGSNCDIKAIGSGQGFSAIPSSNFSSSAARISGVITYITPD